MPAIKLTDKTVQNLTPPPSGRLELFDIIVTGLCIRCTDKGVRSWSLLYRYSGELRRDTIGRYPDMSLAQARQKARERLALVEDKQDPRAVDAAVEAAQEAEKRAAQENNVALLAEEYIRRAPPRRKASKKRVRRYWPRVAHLIRTEVIGRWGDRSITEIKKGDVLRLLDDVVDRGAPVQANRLLDVLKGFFHWAASRDLIEANPVASIDKPTAESARTRSLKDHEIRAVWKAAEQIGWPYGRIIQLLLLTGQRRGDIGGLRWSEIDRDKRLIEIPADRYKTGIDHIVPLSDQAMDIIEGLPRIGDSEFVFTVTGKKPVVTHDKAKTRLDALMPAGTEHWVIHDLRRTVRTKLSEIGIDRDIAERVLGHLPPAIRQTYDRHDFLKERRHALTRWAAELERIVNPPAQDQKVHQLRS